MKTVLSAESKAACLEEFLSLQTLEEKFRFWRETIKEEYVKFLLYSKAKRLSKETEVYWDSLREFRIIPKTDEYKKFNLAILEQQEMFDAISLTKRKLSLPDLISDFENRLSAIAKNKKEFIFKEIEAVKKEVEKRSKVENRFENNIGDFFRTAYEKVYFKSEDIDYSARFYEDIDHLLAIHNGSTYACYMEFLDEELARAGRNAKKIQREITLRQQLLILDYFGLYDKLAQPDNVKKADFLSLIIDKNYQNVRATLSNYHKLKYSTITEEKNKIREDLQVILQLFEEQGLKSLAKKVKEDLQKLG